VRIILKYEKGKAFSKKDVFGWKTKMIL